MKKFLILGVVMVVGLAALSVGYAMWQKTLFINGTVNTGSVNAEWSIHGASDTEIDGKDVSNIVCTGAGTDTITAVVTNAYPSIWYTCNLDITSTGSVPVHLENIVIDKSQLPLGMDPAYVDVEFVGCALGIQLHQDQSVNCDLKVHFANDANAPQGGSFPFSVTAQLVQWNESIY